MVELKVFPEFLGEAFDSDFGKFRENDVEHFVN